MDGLVPFFCEFQQGGQMPLNRLKGDISGLRLCERVKVALLIVLQTIIHIVTKMKEMKGLIWGTTFSTEHRAQVLSLYRQILRSLNSPKLELSLAARLAKKAEARAIFMLGSEERSLHNIADLIDAAEYSLSLLKKGQIPKHIQ